jgi:hypothetical protein
MELLDRYNISVVIGSIRHPEKETLLVDNDESAAAVALGVCKFRRSPVALVVGDVSSLPPEIHGYPVVIFSDSVVEDPSVFPSVLNRAVSCPLSRRGPFLFEDDEHDPHHYVLSRAFMQGSLRPVIVLGRHHDPASVMRWVLSRNIPIVATESSLDLIRSTHNLFIGRVGMDGDRAGNFAVQNADVIIIVGSIDPHPFFAREAHVIQIGRKSNACHAYLPVPPSDDCYTPNMRRDWVERCRHWKQRWANELPLYDGFTPYMFYSLFYQSFTQPKVVVAHKDNDSWYFPAYQQNLIRNGDRFLLSPVEDVLSFVSGIKSDLPIFVFLGAGRFFTMTELEQFRDRNIFIVCMRKDTEENTLSHEQYSSRVPSDRAWYLEEVGEAIGLPYISIDPSTATDILDLRGVAGPYLIDVFYAGDFRPCPRGRHDLPLEEMEPALDRIDHAHEMIIAPHIIS